MTREQILDQLCAMMVTMFEVPREAITLEARLSEDLDLDSIDAIDMAVELHKLTGTKVEEQELRQIHTVADVIDLVQRHLARAKSKP